MGEKKRNVTATMLFQKSIARRGPIGRCGDGGGKRDHLQDVKRRGFNTFLKRERYHHVLEN